MNRRHFTTAANTGTGAPKDWGLKNTPKHKGALPHAAEGSAGAQRPHDAQRV